MPQFVLAIDQGTTGTRAIAYDANGRACASAYQEIKQYYPEPGWVEHDPKEIWDTTCTVIRKVLQGIKPKKFSIASLGITNQRETVVLWYKRTSKPLHRAIVWQDRRTSGYCRKLVKKYGQEFFRNKTGLTVDPYFSGSKIAWLLEHHPRLRKLAESGKILAGTIDAWLLWNLTGGKVHATDHTNASRTLLFNIQNREWDSDLLRVFNIPGILLPEVKSSGALYGQTVQADGIPAGIPIRAVMGDQQAALYGQACYKAGTAKNTYGTGCFTMYNLGTQYQKPPQGLLQTLACDQSGSPVFALEGAVFIAGAAMQWLRDGLGFFKHAGESERMIQGLENSGGVTVIPAFAGLGSPYWNPDVRGRISGITRGTTKAHLIRATLEAVAHQTADIVEAMSGNSEYALKELRVDGGMTHNHFLMQFQADLLQIPVLVSPKPESTAWGAAKLAGAAAGFWRPEPQQAASKTYTRYRPQMAPLKAKELRKKWKEEIRDLLRSEH